MYNFDIPEWDMTKELAQYEKQGYIHQYDLEQLVTFGTSIGWTMSYFTTSERAERISIDGKVKNLDFGSSKNENNTK